MNPLSLSSLATTFIAMSVAMGLPSITVLLLYLGNLIRNRLSTPTPTPNFGENPDAILMILQGMTQAVGVLGRIAGSLGQIALNFLAILSTFAVVLAVAMWFTGRGLQAQTNWARISAFTLLVIALLPSLLLMLSVHHVGRLVMFVVAAFCFLGLHAVWTGYAPSTP